MGATNGTVTTGGPNGTMTNPMYMTGKTNNTMARGSNPKTDTIKNWRPSAG